MNRILFVLLMGALAWAEVHAQVTPAALAREWEAARVIKALPDLEDDQAAQNFQNALIERISGKLGRPVGYKAALTNPKAQQQFGVDQPILGVLLENMLLEDGAELALDYAARPAVEADLLVRVRDPNINEARTDLELLAGLSEVIPFIELADLLLLPGASNDLRTLTALNAGARTGVVGTPVALTADQATLDRLGSFSVRLEDEKGRLYGAGRGADLLGHPIHVVRWMRDALRARGDRLREGDVLSLGTLTPVQALKKPARLTAHYHGLLADPEDDLSVTCILYEAAVSD
jgi:2-keto-4-pentenoate hydratase